MTMMIMRMNPSKDARLGGRLAVLLFHNPFPPRLLLLGGNQQLPARRKVLLRSATLLHRATMTRRARMTQKIRIFSPAAENRVWQCRIPMMFDERLSKRLNGIDLYLFVGVDVS